MTAVPPRVEAPTAARVMVKIARPAGRPTGGAVATLRKERRFERIQGIPVAGAIDHQHARAFLSSQAGPLPTTLT